MLRWFSLWHPEMILLVCLLFGLYAYANAQVSESEARATKRQWTLFVAYIAVLYITFGSPIDVIAQNRRFSVFVVQCLIMTYVMPWLLLAALPRWLTTRLLRVPWVHKTLRIVTMPVVALVTYTIIISLSLAPVVLQANLTYNVLHTADTLMLMIASIFLWWPLVSTSSRLPRLKTPSQLVYLLFAANLMMPVPFFLIASEHVWYKSHFHSNFEPVKVLADQHLGGILMLAGMIVVYGLRATMTLGIFSRHSPE